MKNNILKLAFLLFTTITVYAQNTVSVNLLDGEWHAQENDKYETVIGAEVDKNNMDYILKFLTSDTVYFKENGIEATYTFSVANDALTFNGRSFSILKLTNTELNIQEIGTSSETLNFKKFEYEGY